MKSQKRKSIQSNRKDEHVFLAEKTHQYSDSFSDVRLLNRAIPEIDISQINTKTTFLGIPVSTPLYINAMTGGSDYTKIINKKLALLSAETELPLCLGSGSIISHERDQLSSFEIARQYDPTGIIVVNVSPNTKIDVIDTLISATKANALQIHVNVIQETIMPEGDKDFHWIENIAKIRKHVSIPVIVKEVGFGMTYTDLEKLSKININFVDLSGKGGTNFATIENSRRKSHDFSYLDNIGLTTLESLFEYKMFKNDNPASIMLAMASGGIKNPLDAIIALSQGANNVGMSYWFLHLVNHNSHDEAVIKTKEFMNQMKSLMIIFGAENIEALTNVTKVYSENFINYRKQRRIDLN